MLCKLHIKNFALIDEIEVSFGSGLNVITGETGAGKSILVGALQLLLGARSSTELVRTGETKAFVEGHFQVGERPDVRSLVRESDLDDDPMLIIRRELTRDLSRAFVNDSPVRLDVLKTITANLVDLHGQHDHQSILKSETHLPLLDGFNPDADQAEGYRDVYDRLQKLHARKADLVTRRDELARDRELAEFQIAEIDAVSPEPDEEPSLNEELNILDNIERLVQDTRDAFDALYGSEGSVYDRLSSIVRQLEQLQDVDSRIKPYAEDLRGSTSAIADIAAFLRDYSPASDHDPERADEIRDRLGAFEMLKRKYGGSIESVIQHRQEIGEVYERAGSFDEEIREIEKGIAELQPELGRRAFELSESRKKAAAALEKATVEELGSLGMSGAQFVVSLSHEADPEGWIADGSGERYRAFEDGMDVCEFFLSANRGEPPKPLVKVASGGEVSRIMLALKTILAGSDQVATLVFDEIDTGISGAIAERVGNEMRKLAAEHQVITITHLPQIAAAADSHFVVRKEVADGRTSTSIRELEADERTREIASLLSGTEISSAALESARELIGR